MDKRLLAYISALGAAFFYSLNQIFNKRVVLAVGTLPALTLVYALLTLIDFSLCTLFGDFSLPSLGALLELVFLSVVGAVAILSLFESFKYLPIGVSITLANLSPVFLTLLVFLFEGKMPPPQKVFSITLILLSVYLITANGEKREKIPKKVYLLPLITAFGWALFGWELFRLLNLYRVNLFACAFYTSLYMFVIFLAALFALYGLSSLKLFQRVLKTNKVIKWAAMGGLLTSFGFVLSILPFKWVPPEETPIVEAIFSTSTPIGALLSYLLLGERLTFRQVTGILLAFLALMLFFVG